MSEVLDRFDAAATTASVPASCKYCGSTRGFREVGVTHCSASRVSRTAIRGPDGRCTVAWNSVDVDSLYADDDLDIDYVECLDCEASAGSIDKITGPLPVFETGDAVRCPDGFRGIVAAVDTDRRRITVYGWHETFAFHEVSPFTQVGTR